MSYKKGSDDDLFDFERKNVEGGDVSLCPGKRKNFFCLKIVEKVLTFFMMIFPIRPGGKKLKKFLIYFKHRLEEKLYIGSCCKHFKFISLLDNTAVFFS